MLRAKREADDTASSHELPRPWVLAMGWHDLLFMHWPVPAAALRHAVPPGLTIESFDGTAWIGVVPFQMRGVRPRRHTHRYPACRTSRS